MAGIWREQRLLSEMKVRIKILYLKTDKVVHYFTYYTLVGFYGYHRERAEIIIGNVNKDQSFIYLKTENRLLLQLLHTGKLLWLLSGESRDNNRKLMYRFKFYKSKNRKFSNFKHFTHFTHW